MLANYLLKTKTEYKNLKKEDIHEILIKTKKDKASSQNYLDYGDFYYLSWRAASDRVSHDKTFNIAKNPKFDGY